MIVRFFNTGTSNGEFPVGYLLRMRDHQGNLRPEAPELLAGSPQLTIDLLNGISRNHKYASGCLAFRPGESPSRAELFNILDRFKAVVAVCQKISSTASLLFTRKHQTAKRECLGFMCISFCP